MKQKVIALVGPTSSGKSALGVFLAQKLDGEIISADSRQVYKGLNVGTGKITKKEMGGIPHHLLDVSSPKKQFSASDFVKKAEQTIKKISSNKKLPIIVGGTGYYTDTLLGRMIIPEVPPNPALRVKLEKKSPAELFNMLKKKDPRRAATIEPHHKRRLIRALEIAEALGKNPAPLPIKKYQVLWLGIQPEEKKLQKNIHVRLLSRMKSGMIKEAQNLHRAGLSYKRMEELGLEYRFLALYLQKKITSQEMLAQLESAINAYAKRQKRWFKRNPEIIWVSNKRGALEKAKGFIASK